MGEGEGVDISSDQLLLYLRCEPWNRQFQDLGSMELGFQYFACLG